VTAIGLAVYALLTALFFHHDFSDADQLIHFQKNLTIAGGFLALAALGAGRWSLDGWLAKRLNS
jgi:putative oxidoreductase